MGKSKKKQQSKRTKSVEKPSILLLGYAENPFTKVVTKYYDVPFSFKSAKRYTVDRDAIRNILEAESGFDRSRSCWLMVWLQLKPNAIDNDEEQEEQVENEGDEIWLAVPPGAGGGPSGISVSVDPPESATRTLINGLAELLVRYEIKQILSVHLHILSREFPERETKRKRKYTKRRKTAKKSGKKTKRKSSKKSVKKKATKGKRHVKKSKKKAAKKTIKKATAKKRQKVTRKVVLKTSRKINVKTKGTKRKIIKRIRGTGHRKPKGRKAIKNRRKLPSKRRK